MPARKRYIDFGPLEEPPEPVEGRIYYDANERKLKYWDGESWKEVTYNAD